MRPSASFFEEGNYLLDGVHWTYFGELNENNILHGRGIKIWNIGAICLGYQENGEWTTGNSIYIFSDGSFRVGDVYFEDGVRRERGIQY